MSFEELGSFGTSLSSVLRDSLSAGAKGMVAGPEENKAIALQFDQAKRSSIDIFAFLLVEETWARIFQKTVEAALVEILKNGLKRGFDIIAGRKKPDYLADIEKQSKILERIDASVSNIADILARLEATRLDIRVADQPAFYLDKDDIEVLTVEPQPGTELIAEGYPLQLHLNSPKGWLRITKADENQIFANSSYRMEIDPVKPEQYAALKDHFSQTFDVNIRSRTNQSLQLVVQPLVSRRGLVKVLKVKGFAHR